MALVVKDLKLSKIDICNQRVYFKNIFMLVTHDSISHFR